MADDEKTRWAIDVMTAAKGAPEILQAIASTISRSAR
jgi:hypothetical protein